MGASVLLVGCIDTDPAVFVEAGIENAQATVAQETLATTIEGSFDVALHLGPRASGPADVGLGRVSVLSGDQASTLVDVLAVEPSPPFPVTVPVDGDVRVAVSFAAADNLLEADDYDALCAAGAAVVSAALDDSLRGGTISAVSVPFVLAGCP
ncbi:MAG: hypothetical protein JRI23_09710 [Deltaproteobacteria bacterium]|nr:hypothetical protein [Deltaproteobacteria bacterium]MBW2531931.1 hypothetical protein [Deltaproteobacteria bacterium]